LNFFNQGEFRMRHFLLLRQPLSILAAVVLGATFPVAHAQHSDKEKKEDIQRHRAMAAAHEAAAQCLEAGKKEEVCEKELQAACKGLAIGKYCGLKHVH
jgi:hypothetical protein